MFKHLFIIIYTSISNDLQNRIRSSRTYTLVSYLLSFWIINISITFYILFDLKNQIHIANKMLLCFLAICVFITIYFFSETYYGKSGRDKIYIALYESYGTEKKRWLRFSAFLLMITTIAVFIYLGSTF